MKKVLLLIGIMFSMCSVFAADNVLQTIEIVPVKDTYNIVLVADKSVDVKKSVQASNKITLTMKDIRASKTLNTVYNNVSNVDTVMVEPQGNGISIFFQAENADKASVSFDSMAAPMVVPQAKTTKRLKLNNPIESYTPIYNEDLNGKTSSLFDRLKSRQTIDGIKDSLDDGSASDTANKLISFGLITLLVVGIVKLFRRKQPDMKIGLTQSLNDREIGLYKNNQPFQQGYQSLEKPFTTVNYGLNAYKNDGRNPYESAPVEFHNPRLRNYASNFNQAPMRNNTMQQTVQNTVTAPQQTAKVTTPVNTATVNQSNPNVDNIKFLQSMTAIYEKSGRHDLARGLQASLSRNNIK